MQAWHNDELAHVLAVTQSLWSQLNINDVGGGTKSAKMEVLSHLIMCCLALFSVVWFELAV